MSETLFVRILNINENNIQLEGCSCIAILKSTVLTSPIPTTNELQFQTSNLPDEDLLSILIKQNGENIVKSFITLGALRRDRNTKVRLEPLGAKAEIGSVFTSEIIFDFAGDGIYNRTSLLESKTENPFQYNLYKSGASVDIQSELRRAEDFYATLGGQTDKLITQGIYAENYIYSPTLHISPTKTSENAYGAVGIEERERIKVETSNHDVNHLIADLRSSVQEFEKNLTSKTVEAHYQVESAGIATDTINVHNVHNFAQSAPVYSTEDFRLRTKQNYSPEFGHKDLYTQQSENVKIFGETAPLKTSEIKDVYLSKQDEKRDTLTLDRQSFLLKYDGNTSKQFTETARSIMDDVKIEKNQDYLLTMKNQLSSKHISFIHDGFTREIILYMAQTKKKVSAIRLRRSITIRDKEEVDIDKKDYFNSNCNAKYVHFFKAGTNILHLFNLIQPFELIDEQTKKVELNINFDISPIHKSVITPAGLIFVACAEMNQVSSNMVLGSNTLHVYNYKNQSLVERPSMMCQTRQEFGFCYMSKNLFVIGGLVNGTISNKCERYDIRSNKWIKIASMTRPLREVAVCSFNSRYLYRFFGIDSGNNIDHSIERYDAVRDTWTVMNVPINENIKEIYIPFCTQVNQDCIFIFGGKNINGFSPKSCKGWILKVEDKRGSNNAELFETKNFIPGLAGTFNSNSLLTHAGDVLFLREDY